MWPFMTLNLETIGLYWLRNKDNFTVGFVVAGGQGSLGERKKNNIQKGNNDVWGWGAIYLVLDMITT